jgi:anthranilate synthase component 2
MKILLLDNYDSFTYNLVHMINEITGDEITVRRNDEISIEEAEQFDCIILSPGPGIPDEAGIMKEMIEYYAGKKPMFGVCLGLQAIVEVFGGKIENLNQVFHGVATPMIQTTNNSPIYDGIEKRFEAGRYHSWVAEKESFPKCLEITSEDEEGRIMSVQHKEYEIYAVQFHPESILTPLGKEIVGNFLKKANLRY